MKRDLHCTPYKNCTKWAHWLCCIQHCFVSNKIRSKIHWNLLLWHCVLWLYHSSLRQSGDFLRLLNFFQQSIYECKKSVECLSKPSSNILISNGVLRAFRGHHVGAGTLPIFNSRTGLPVSSSPVSIDSLTLVMFSEGYDLSLCEMQMSVVLMEMFI